MHDLIEKAECYRVYDDTRELGSKFGCPKPLSNSQRSSLNDSILIVVGWDTMYNAVLMARPNDVATAKLHVKD
jgi:hypothetical protein